jgi:hypothetical protein
MFEFDEAGIYRCVNCDEPYSPGHNLHCAKQERKGGGRRQVRPQNIGRQIEDGMKIIYMCEKND